MYDGIINVYKEKGFTSHDVVAKMRGILGQRKIGHTGYSLCCKIVLLKRRYMKT